MDLRQYFRKIQDLEAAITEPFPVVVSLETEDGGKAGLFTEVSRANAAKMIAEGRAVLAGPEEKMQFTARQLANRRVAEAAEATRRVQVAIVSEADLAHITGRKSSHQK